MHFFNFTCLDELPPPDEGTHSKHVRRFFEYFLDKLRMESLHQSIVAYFVLVMLLQLGGIPVTRRR